MRAWAPRPYECDVDRAWIDYNGHLRDGYFVLVASASIDALMDDLGLDATYRRARGCTLYTVEAHVRFLREVKGDARLCIGRYPAEVDARRLRLLITVQARGAEDLAAVLDVMLVHVQQEPVPRAVPFPADIRERLAQWHAGGVPGAVAGLGARVLTLQRPAAASP